MVNFTILWLAVVPLICSAITFFVLRKFADSDWKVNVGWVLGGFFISLLIITACVLGSVGYQTADKEIWNGQVVSKDRVHGSYVESYDCNCRDETEYYTDHEGKRKSRTVRKCDTCYRDHFTVEWTTQTTLGSYRIQKEDWTNKKVYALPDPPRYTEINMGDPVAKTNTYNNYIKAVPQTLFTAANETLKNKFAGQIPEYPIHIYDYYKVDRVIPVGIALPDVKLWNTKLSHVLKVMGPNKQANAVIVLVKSNDPDYFYALQDAWAGAKKNDIVVVIGVSSLTEKPVWANIIALTDNSLFKIKLRDDIMSLESITADGVINALFKNTMESFKRKSMKDFKYLENEIDPPTWLMVSTVVFNILAYAGFWFAIFKQHRSNRISSYRKVNFRLF